VTRAARGAREQRWRARVVVVVIVVVEGSMGRRHRRKGALVEGALERRVGVGVVGGVVGALEPAPRCVAAPAPVPVRRVDDVPVEFPDGPPADHLVEINLVRRR